MPHFARRLWGALLLSALLAGSITTIADAAPVKTGRPVYHAAASTRNASIATHRRRRARRAPPGGVVWARNAIVLDPATGEVLFEKNSDSSVPIASLSKLMTVMVFLEQKPDLDRQCEVTREEISGGGHTQLRNGEMVSLRDLLHMGLMCSDNVATRVLARESGLSREDFLARMNHKAIELGMTHTRFVEFTGLDERNVSTAADVARMLHAAADIDLVREITTTRTYAFRTQRRAHQISNTNRLLFSRYEIVGGKTGFINEAGYCFATWLHTQGRDLIAVVLGAPTNATRFADTIRMVQRTTTASIAQP